MLRTSTSVGLACYNQLNFEIPLIELSFYEVYLLHNIKMNIARIRLLILYFLFIIPEIIISS